MIGFSIDEGKGMKHFERKEQDNSKNRKIPFLKASLTIEAALALPLFLYFMIALLYIIQILILQEYIQAAITKMGFQLSKSAYVLEDFPSLDSALSFDFTVFDEEYELSIKDFTNKAASNIALKMYGKKYLDTNQINHSFIKGGFGGISFNGSSLFEEDYIDIVVRYKVQLPIKLIIIEEVPVLQRIRLHCWTGSKVAAAYKEEVATEESIVYVTETGSVYHKTDLCSHIKLSVRSVMGIPNGIKNTNGEKYTPCEVCSEGDIDEYGTFYITDDGNRYHSMRNCSRIKRTVRKISITEIGERTSCKRCYD